MSKTALLLINLGTPRSPRLKDVFHYLNEFLTDGRVIDLPWLQRQLLVRGAIVPARLRQSARSYQRIWTEKGSPLMVYSLQVKEELQKILGKSYCVEFAMRYQTPSIEEGLAKLLQQHPEHLIILPLFPQYASATTGSVHQKVMEVLRSATHFPQISFLSHFAYHPAFHEALCQVAAPFSLKDYDHILFSYHGLPERQVKQNRGCLQNNCCRKEHPFCYVAQCHATTRGVVERLKIPEHLYSICFQSRLGKEPWLQPYASDTIISLAKKGKRKVLVFCPSFVCDCLETLFEIGEEYSHLFKKEGGEQLDLVPGLNVHPAWIKALQKIVADLEK